MKRKLTHVSTYSRRCCKCNIIYRYQEFKEGLHNFAPFDYTINDLPSLRKWWCLLLMENFELDSFGRIFAHWTEESSAVLQGHHVFAHWTEESSAVLQGHHVALSKLRQHKRAEVDQEPAVVRDLCEMDQPEPDTVTGACNNAKIFDTD
ncbi:uncharacterized protein LOC143527371 isoform X3 [Brachyhypopomus gauderio]|uniref:uncharacterized protein LOC143527371 isoform X3 n=1 Tax=Brachyhypopomus gauderio TaxID=698409 RepID=UPI0040417E69